LQIAIRTLIEEMMMAYPTPDQAQSRPHPRRTMSHGMTMALVTAAFAAGGLLLPGLGAGTAQAQVKADPYRWCADFGGRGGGGTSCYYTSFEQCRRELVGRGGFCRPNPFYTGARRTTDGYRNRRHRDRGDY
jgi:hypothetical protein